MVKQLLDSTTGLVKVKVSGTHNAQDLLAAIDKLYNNPEFPRNLRVLEDSEECTPKMEVSDMPKVFAKLNQFIPLFESVKHAVIHSDPTATAMVMLFKSNIKHKHFQMEVFSTEQAAMNWLMK